MRFLFGRDQICSKMLKYILIDGRKYLIFRRWKFRKINDHIRRITRFPNTGDFL